MRSVLRHTFALGLLWHIFYALGLPLPSSQQGSLCRLLLCRGDFGLHVRSLGLPPAIGIDSLAGPRGELATAEAGWAPTAAMHRMREAVERWLQQFGRTAYRRPVST